MGSKVESWGFYFPLNSQGHIGTGLQLCDLWESNLWGPLPVIIFTGVNSENIHTVAIINQEFHQSNMVFWGKILYPFDGDHMQAFKNGNFVSFRK